MTRAIPLFAWDGSCHFLCSRTFEDINFSLKIAAGSNNVAQKTYLAMTTATEIIPRTARCEAIFVILSAANQVVRHKAMHKTKQREV